MESTQSEVITHRCVVTETGISPTEYWFSVDALPARFWTKKDHTFKPGDHVRITITKEPAPDVIPR